MATLPTVITSSGLTPRTPVEVRAQLIASIIATNPGYTADLPGSLIEDISSTDVAAIMQAETARVDAVNSLTPYGSNAFILNQQGQMFGVPYGTSANTSVFVQFTGTPGFPIGKGFLVSDGVYQYVVQDGGVIGTDNGTGLGTSALLFCVATDTGSWAVPSNTVNVIQSSVPNTVTLTVTNPTAGVPATTAESEEDYRAKVIQAGLASTQGTPAMLKTLVGNVSGVQAQLISLIQLPLNGGWEIIVGGGDPYQVAYAILQSGIDLAAIVGSTLSISNVTVANPGVYTVDKNHGLVTGQVATVASANPANYNHTGAVTVIDNKTFSFTGFSTIGFPAYVSGGVLTPNNRNIVVSINDFPDTYTVPYVNPPQQTVSIVLTWNTSAVNFVSASAVTQAAQPAIVAYINAIPVGQPINIFQMQQVFLASIAGILDPTLVTRMVWVVTINGVVTPPTAGTDVVPGDPESYFFTSTAQVAVNQG